MISEEHGLMVTIDVQPSEQIGYPDDMIACVCATFCHYKGIEGLLQYKDTPAEERPDVAKDLAKQLSEKKIVRAMGFIARYQSIERYGTDFLSDLPENVARKVGTRYRIMGKRINEKVAVMLPWYGFALCLVALRAAIWANKKGIKKVTIIADKLPGSPEIAMEFLRRLSHHPDIFPLWKKTQEEFDVEFNVANMGSYKNADRIEREPDEHPAMIMADWLAHSLFAATNKAEDLDGEAERDEEYRKAITEPWFELYENELMDLVPLDNLITNPKE